MTRKMICCFFFFRNYFVVNKSSWNLPSALLLSLSLTSPLFRWEISNIASKWSVMISDHQIANIGLSVNLTSHIVSAPLSSIPQYSKVLLSGGFSRSNVTRDEKRPKHHTLKNADGGFAHCFSKLVLIVMFPVLCFACPARQKGQWAGFSSS